MRRLIKFLSLPFIVCTVMLFVNSCTRTSRSTDTVQKITRVLDSLQKIYAPDTRVKLWKYTVGQKGDSVVLHLMLDNAKAFEAVQTVLSSEFQGVKANVELLPEKNRDLQVTALANNSVINLRSGPHHSAELATQVRLGTPLKVLKKEGEWYLVQCPDGYIAWTDDDAIVEINKRQLNAYKEARKVVYNKMCGFSYSAPDLQSQVVSDLSMGCILAVSGEEGAFYRVRYPDGRRAFVLIKDVVDFAVLANSLPAIPQLIRRAKRFNGTPYMWGGSSSKAVDCSGFTSLLYFMNGIVLQRDASQQTKYGKVITTKYDTTGLKPGDLLFFGRPATASLSEKVTHVALYTGNGQFIHASGKVRINSMIKTDSNFIESYPPRFVRAVRIENNMDGTGIRRINGNPFYREILK